MGLEIAVKNLIKVYRIGTVEVQALRGLNMSISRGEMVSIIGPSGSGKTTFLNIIGGLDLATARSVMVGDTEVTSLSPSQLIEYRRKTVGHIFQTLNLIPNLTAAENVELPMLALGVGGNKRGERTRNLFDIMGLTQRMDHKPDELSGGEQQRVAIAAALANNPPVILADEPTGELDTVNARMVTEYLLKVNKELKKTVIMVTHDSSVARAADRIMRIEDGMIKAFLEPIQVLEEAPTTSYIEQLRARMIEIDAQLEKLDEAFRVSRITGDEYVEQRLKLKRTRITLQDELHRMGVTT
jgi:putative ABC transport system ATP-binding protein